MLDIYICEDNPKQLNLLKQYISDTIMIEELDMRIAQATSDPHIILEESSVSENLGVFFLDIDLNADMDGLVLAQKIRKIQPRCFIIFVTSHTEMSFLTFQYKVEALDFIIKDTPEHIKSKAHECLLNVQQKYISLNKNINTTFLIKQGERLIAVEYSDIIFFETSANIHKLILHGRNQILEFSGQLKAIESQLDHRFYKCHRSFLVNRDNIENVDFDTLTIYMNNGDKCPISIRAKRGLKKLLR